MKKFLLFITAIFLSVPLYAINLYYMNEDDTVYESATCTVGDDLILPTPPTKRGYTFAGWRAANIQRIEYLESTGTQYIDTGYTFDGTVKLIFKINWNNVDGVIFGANSSGGENFLWASSGYLMGSRFDISPAIQKNIDYIVEMQMYKNNSYIKINNVIMGLNKSSSTNNLPIFLFAESSFGGISKKVLKLYYFQIYVNDILVRDFIPVIKDGTPCLYDLVEHKFYYNAGTGQFIAGPIIGSGE